MKTILNYFGVVNSGELTNSSKFADFIKEVEKANKVKILTFSLTREKIILYSEVDKTGDFYECELQDNELHLMVHGTIYKAPTALKETRLEKIKAKIQRLEKINEESDDSNRIEVAINHTIIHNLRDLLEY